MKADLNQSKLSPAKFVNGIQTLYRKLYIFDWQTVEQTNGETDRQIDRHTQTDRHRLTDWLTG